MLFASKRVWREAGVVAAKVLGPGVGEVVTYTSSLSPSGQLCSKFESIIVRCLPTPSVQYIVDERQCSLLVRLLERVADDLRAGVLGVHFVD